MQRTNRSLGKSRQDIRRTVTGSSDMTIRQLFDLFYQAKVAEGRALRTLAAYRENFGYFEAYIHMREVRDIKLIISPGFIREYIAWMLHDRVQFAGHPYAPKRALTGLSPVTVNTRLKTMRTLFEWLSSEGMWPDNPLHRIKPVEEPHDEITVLTVSQLRTLLRVPNQSTYSGFRDYVLMNVLLDTMARINEALQLEIRDIDVKAGTVTIRAEIAKSRKPRTLLPVQPSTMNQSGCRDSSGILIQVKNGRQPLIGLASVWFGAAGRMIGRFQLIYVLQNIELAVQ
jgi:integrase/recombinase XerD